MQSEELLKRFESDWNLFLDEVKSTFPKKYYSGDEKLQELHATENSAARILVHVVRPVLLPLPVTAVGNMEKVLLDTSIVLGGIKVSDMFRDENTPSKTRDALIKYVTVFHFLANALPPEAVEATPVFNVEEKEFLSQQTEDLFGKQLGGAIKDLTEEVMKNKEVSSALEEVVQSPDLMTKLQENPFAILAELSDSNGKLGKAMRAMGGSIENKLKNDPEFAKRIEDGIPDIMNNMLSKFGKGAPDSFGKIFETMKGALGGKAGAGGGAGDIPGLAKMFGGMFNKNEDDDLPAIDDITKNVHRQMRTEFRQATQREALRKKLDARRNNK